MSFGGGGGTGGGALVQSVSPGAYQQSAQIITDASNAAAQAYQTGVNSAMKQLQQAYGVASSNLQPYTQTGIQALDQLNYYLGLDAYKPTAPTAPTAPNIQNLARDVTANDIIQYARQNINPIGSDQTPGFGQYTGYLGPGMVQGNADAFTNVSELTPSTPGLYGFGNEIANKYLGANMTPDEMANNPMAQFLAQQKLSQANKEYQNELASYNLQKDQYDYAQNLYDQYQAKGPISAGELNATIASQPGYQAEINQGLAAINNMASAGNQLGSGRTMTALSQYGQNTLSKYYNNMLGNLQTLAGGGQQAATNLSGIGSNLAGQGAQAQIGLGSNIGNSYLAAANAQAQSAIGQGTSYKQIGGGGGGGMDLGGLGSLIGGLSGLF